MTIFWVLFETNIGKHDRSEFFDCVKSTNEFWEWILLKRRELEADKGKCVMLDCKII